MAWIYRYTDLTDGIIKYIGVVWSSNRTLQQRIQEHKLNDEWCKTGNWKIEYLDEDIDTRNEAEAIESHYISLYETWKYYNKNKRNHGTNKYLFKINDNWKPLDEATLKSTNDLSDKTITMTIRITEDRKQKLKEFAIFNKTTISNLISKFVDEL